MNRINALFQQKPHRILSVFCPAGYPSLNSTLEVLTELQAAGVNMVEIGIPFSDPMADGPTIQQASSEALRNGMSLRVLFDQLEGLRPSIRIPVLLMGYLNPILQYGFESFCQRCKAVGVDGVIIPDLPFAEYVEQYSPVAQQYGIRMVMLITPQTSDERIRLIDRHTEGFIYMVSSASTTGTQSCFDRATMDYFERIDRMKLTNPRLVGFGISNPATLEAAHRYASGAIVGSRFVQLLATSASPREGVEALLKSLGQLPNPISCSE